jgi:hypothetical protein
MNRSMNRLLISAAWALSWACGTALAAPTVNPPDGPAAVALAAPLAASAPAPAPGAGRVWLAGPAGAALTLPEALRQAADGDVIELMPGVYKDRLLIERRRLTIRGMRGGEAVMVQGAGPPMAERALWTVRGGELLLEEIEFRGARSANGSGAAVLLEGGRLTLRRCRFFDNEHSLATNNDAQAELVVEGSVFGMAPKVVGGLHHLVTVGRIARFSVTGTRFQQGFEGHLLKSRARENLIAYNFVHDGQRGGASLEIDLPLGGLAQIVGNVIGQGADTQNPVMVSYGSEGSAWDVNRLRVVHNTFVNHGWVPAWFLRVHGDQLPAGTEVVAINNLLVGMGVFEWGNPGFFAGNHHARRGQLADLDTYAFELPPSSPLRGAGIDPRRVGSSNLAPEAEFDWSEGRKPLNPPPAGRSSWSPGAFQK